jgi:8-oxo-dGTP pyrophosphatase MutT (NUDIX family)
LIVVDNSGAEPRLLMGRRNPNLAFMPGKFVFPGGRVDPADRLAPIAADLRAEVERRLLVRMHRPSRRLCRALALSAIRETYEETGLLIGAPAQSAAPPVLPPPGPTSNGWASFHANGWWPDLANLAYVARAITPPKRPRRFDTRFFAVSRAHVVHQERRTLDGSSELRELAWVSPREAQGLDLPAITHVVISELAERLRDGLDLDRPIPFYYERHGRFIRDEL